MRRAARIIILVALLWAGIEISQTTPYLGLPFEPKPVECYEQAHWNGSSFVYTGQTICLE